MYSKYVVIGVSKRLWADLVTARDSFFMTVE